MLDLKKKAGKSVIYLEVENSDKELLRVEAKSKGLQLIPFCRMVLLEHIKKVKKENDLDELSKQLGMQ